MVLAPFVHLRKERFGAVLFDTLREKVFVTNETGRRMLELLIEGKEIASTLCQEYEISKEAAEQEEAKFIGLLKENGLLADA